MITQLNSKRQPGCWQTSLKNCITQVDELLHLLELKPEQLPVSLDAHQQFNLRVPRAFAARMQPGNPNDPLLLQVLPVTAEMMATPGYHTDPLQEQAKNPIPGLIHKYQGRVLLTVAGACAINCRYCFRRHFPYAENNPGKQGWQRVLEYIKSDDSITEVILSGGDPLLVKDEPLAQLANQLAAIPHVKTLRIHSRLPIVLPDRIDDNFVNWFSNLPLRSVLVVHSNHPNEIDTAVTAAMQKLRQNNITVLNQTVLLKHINDTVHTLQELSERLFDAGILPYYLHVLDKVQGAAHFAIDKEQAKLLMHSLIAKLPGYLVPKLVQEVPKANAKKPICFEL